MRISSETCDETIFRILQFSVLDLLSILSALNVRKILILIQITNQKWPIFLSQKMHTQCSETYAKSNFRFVDSDF